MENKFKPSLLLSIGIIVLVFLALFITPLSRLTGKKLPQDDEGPVGARAVVVQGGGQELLADPAFPVDDHGGAARGDAHHRVAQGLHGRVPGDDPVEAEAFGQLLLQDADLPVHLVDLVGAVHQQADLGQVEGLDDEIEDPALDGLHRGVQVGIGGHQDHRGARAQLQHGAHGLDAGHARHPDVHEDDVRRAWSGTARGLPRRPWRLAVWKPFPGQHGGQQAADAVVVVDDQDLVVSFMGRPSFREAGQDQGEGTPSPSVLSTSIRPW